MTNLTEELDNVLLDYGITEDALWHLQEKVNRCPSNSELKYYLDTRKASKAKKQIELIDFIVNNSDSLKQQLMELIPKD
jgi:ferritin-like metal-binding protein YciE